MLIALLILSAAACTKNTEPAAPNAETAAPASSAEDLTKWKTPGDIWGFESFSSGIEGDLYIRIFKTDDVYYRVETAVSQDLAEKLYAIDYFDETKEAQQKELLKDLPIQKINNLSEALFSQSELDALAGKTGQELLDMGFVPTNSYGFGTQEQVSRASMEKGPFEYEVRFKEYVDVDEDPNVAAVIRPLTVKSVTLFGVSQYSFEKDFDINGGRTLEDYESAFTGN